jgi:hypothetical protein
MRLGLGRWFGRDGVKDIMTYVPRQYGGLGLPEFPGLEHVLPPHIACAIENADDPTIRKLAGGISSRRVRGMIVDVSEAEKLLADRYGLRVYTRDEVMEDVEQSNTLPKHYPPSKTSTMKSMIETYVPLNEIARPEQKVVALQRAFNPKVNTTRFLTYGQRQRRIHAGFKAYFVEVGRPMIDTEKVLQNLKLYPRHFDLYVRKAEVDNVIPTPLLPSLTVKAEEMGGTVDFLRELPTSPAGTLPD